jgi:hypothetical protein
MTWCRHSIRRGGINPAAHGGLARLLAGLPRQRGIPVDREGSAT